MTRNSPSGTGSPLGRSLWSPVSQTPTKVSGSTHSVGPYTALRGGGGRGGGGRVRGGGGRGGGGRGGVEGRKVGEEEKKELICQTNTRHDQDSLASTLSRALATPSKFSKNLSS